jgi:hypothetical protein
MTSKDFNGLAAALAPFCPTFTPEGDINHDGKAAFLEMVDNIADVCQRANSNFNRQRFTLACQGA